MLMSILYAIAFYIVVIGVSVLVYFAVRYVGMWQAKRRWRRVRAEIEAWMNANPGKVLPAFALEERDDGDE